MPIYEYQCNDCGHELDALQKISDPPLVSCPGCNADSLRKKISAPQFRLKGSGWYETDFKKDKRRNLADAGDGSGAGSATNKGAKDGDSKAAGTSSKSKDKPGAGAASPKAD